MPLYAWFILIMFVVLVLLPLGAYLTAKLARAGWLRGEQAAKRHEDDHQNDNHKPRRGVRSDGDANAT